MKQCEVCERGSQMGGVRRLLRGHYNPTNYVRKYPNLQKVRLADRRQFLLCMKCRKSVLRGKVTV